MVSGFRGRATGVGFAGVVMVGLGLEDDDVEVMDRVS